MRRERYVRPVRSNNTQTAGRTSREPFVACSGNQHHVAVTGRPHTIDLGEGLNRNQHSLLKRCIIVHSEITFGNSSLSLAYDAAREAGSDGRLTVPVPEENAVCRVVRR